jgi:hypothetical protein
LRVIGMAILHNEGCRERDWHARREAEDRLA